MPLPKKIDIIEQARENLKKMRPHIRLMNNDGTCETVMLDDVDAVNKLPKEIREIIQDFRKRRLRGTSIKQNKVMWSEMEDTNETTNTQNV